MYKLLHGQIWMDARTYTELKYNYVSLTARGLDKI